MHSTRARTLTRPGYRRPAALLLAALALTALLFLLGGQTALALDSDDELTLHADNDTARGIWGNATTIWVADDNDTIYAYNRLNGTRDSSNDFGTLNAAGNDNPRGIWSDGTTMYVADFTDDKVYAYNMATKARDSGKDFNLHSAHDSPRGIWGDGTTLWVAEDGSSGNNQVLAYKLNPGQNDHGNRDSGKDFTTLDGAGNQDIEGITSDGTTMYVADRTDNKIYAYKMSDKSHDTDRDFALDSNNGDPEGIWAFADNEFYVADRTDNKLYVYNLADVQGRLVAHTEFALDSDNADPDGIWSDGTTIWVVNDGTGAGNKLFAYDRSDGDYDSSQDFETLQAAGNLDPHGIWSDGTTMYVVDSSDDKVYAYNLSTKARDSANDIDLHSDNGDPEGITGYGDTLWVVQDANGSGQKLFAYKLNPGQSDHGDREPGKDVNILEAAGNTNPKGIWTDGATMYVADSSDDKVYAYKMSNQSRDRARDFDLDADNDYPEGIWSYAPDRFAAKTFYVADQTDDKLYVYTVVPADIDGPVLLSAVVATAGTEIALTFDEGLDTSPWTAAYLSQLEVTADGQAVTFDGLSISPAR